MKVTLITLQDDLNCYGIRCLSSVLREKGVQTQLLFLDRWGPFRAMTEYKGQVREFESSVHDQVAALCADSDLVGFSVLTMYYEESARMTDELKKRIKAPIVWGGMHTICEPEECLRHADAICLGEAEDTLVELVDRVKSRRDFKGLNGVWYREGTDIIRNAARQPARDLDRFPHPDISTEGHFVLRDGVIRPLTVKELLKRWDHHYMTINSRGCSMRCTYCCNSQLSSRFDWTFVRPKSVGKIMDEFKQAVRRYPSLQGIKLSDDAFGDLPDSYIRDFSMAYKKEIGRPLGIPGFSPANLTEEKLQWLTEAGLVYLRIGIQSGSPSVRKMYGRHDSNEQIEQAVNLVWKYRKLIKRLKLDIITDNPWESEGDVIESIRLLNRLPKPYVLAVFSLTLFPGTPLYIKARHESLLKDGEWVPYRRHFYNLDEGSRLNKILWLFKRPVVYPKMIERLVSVYKEPEAFEGAYRRYNLRSALDVRNWPVGRWLKTETSRMW